MKKLSWFFFSLLLSATLTACGGGGGSGGPSFSSISYTGATSQATISDTNAVDFSLPFLEGSAGSNKQFLAVQQASTTNSQPAQHQTVVKLLDKTIRQAITRQLQNNSNNPVAASQSFPGQCSGHPGSMTISDSSTMSSVNVTLTFNNFCGGDLNAYGYEFVAYGQVHVTGSYFLDANDDPVFQSLNQNIIYMESTVTIDNGISIDTFSHVMSGEVGIVFTGSTFATNTPVSLTISINFEDANGNVYRIVNLYNDFSGYLDGTLYHPVYGSVDVVTLSPFTLYTNGTADPSDDQYCGGSLQVTDINGDYIIFSDSSVFGDCSTYTIEFYNSDGSPSATYTTIVATWP